jgi:hypothetical protein
VIWSRERRGVTWRVEISRFGLSVERRTMFVARVVGLNVPMIWWGKWVTMTEAMPNTATSPTIDSLREMAAMLERDR